MSRRIPSEIIVIDMAVPRQERYLRVFEMNDEMSETWTKP